MATMKALRWFPQKKELMLVTVPRPVLTSDNNVIVKMAYAGVCATDLSVLKTTCPHKWEANLGHENCGIIHQIGADVTGLKPGDKVAINPLMGCGQCKLCMQGKPHLCLEYGLSKDGIKGYLGMGERDGGWAEFCQVAAKDILVIDPKLPLEFAVLCEPVSCLVNAFKRSMPLPTNGRVLILGCGIAGMLLAIIMHHHGYRDVTITQRSEKRRKIAERLGLGFTICHPDAIEATIDKDDIDEGGFDLIVDCSGNTDAIQAAIPYIARSGMLNVYGVCQSTSELKVNPVSLLNEIRITGSFLNPFTFKEAADLIAALAPKWLDFEKIGVKMYKLDEYAEAFAALGSKNITKAVFDFTTESK